MGHTYTNLHTHIIFSTKDRIPYLNVDTRPQMFAYMAGIARNIGCDDVAINGMADHAHILLKVPPALSVAQAVKEIKANAGKWAHEEHLLPRAFAWQAGYSAFSVSPSSALVTLRYIQNQEEHHRKISFREEILAFLKKHGIEYDERYVLG